MLLFVVKTDTVFLRPFCNCVQDRFKFGRLKGTVAAVDDPAIVPADRTIVMNDTRVTVPEAPLIDMELNRIYTVDVYLYIEGCDPDCSDSIGLQEADLYLAFYGILKE